MGQVISIVVVKLYHLSNVQRLLSKRLLNLTLFGYCGTCPSSFLKIHAF